VPLLNKRSVERVVLARRNSNLVGHSEVPSVLEIAHYYHGPTTARPSLQYEHRFCYRNFFPETFTLDRVADVRGPATYKPASTFPLFTILARQLNSNPVEIVELPPAATLHADADEGQVHTEVKLLPTGDHAARLPSTIRLVVVGDVANLDGCCG
jgi:hypothetical protein